MLKDFKTKNKLQKGFTIIEVMIVLAIAGLILVVVLIAIPQLQRNQRNSARQAVMSRMVTEISNYAGNNNGQIPDDTEIDDFYERYLGLDVNTEDPTTGDSIPIIWRTDLDTVPPTDQAPVAVDVDPATGVPAVTGGGQLGVAYYQTDSACDGESVITGQGGRNFVLLTLLEGGAIYCLDTK